MNSKVAFMFLMLVLLIPVRSMAQEDKTENFIVQGEITSNTDKLAPIGVNVSEVDDNTTVL